VKTSQFGMNRLIIFDLDGVLIDSKEIHFKALNEALATIDIKYQISILDHVKVFDGMNTRDKLNLLSKQYGLPRETHDIIWLKKQEFTEKLLADIGTDLELVRFFKGIKERNIHIAVASNSIRTTVEALLCNLGIMEFVDLYLGNEDVANPKPFPEIYWKCMVEFYALPSRTVVFEDSRIGRQGAIESGAHLISIRNRVDFDQAKVSAAISFIEEGKNNLKNETWVSSDLNILIPMAGAGSRFAEAGFTFPKPLIEVLGMPMIQAVVENLNIKAQFIFIVQEKDYIKYNLAFLLNLIAPECKIVRVEGLTEGAACTTLLAKSFIDSEKSLLLANSDQIINWDAAGTMYNFESSDIDGGILTFKSIHPKWSYARTDDTGFVQEVAEKKPISDQATVGVYYWRRGSDYVKYAEKMIESNDRVNGEFYVCPVFNYAIADGKKVKTINVEKMWGIGTPEDLEVYLRDENK
jgi:beta-phosphoglucomutase-like phosphatase (HAD superfamily)/dTDP-glucose pyrophosphorylase